MKKILNTLLILIASFILVSCAANFDMGSPQINDELSYNWQTLTYTNLDLNDIFSQTSQPIDDIVILHQKAYEKTLSQEAYESYVHLFYLMQALSIKENQMIGSYLNYSSSEFQEALTTYNLSATITDIYMFNALKDLKALTFNDILSKTDYYHLRTDLSLSTEDLFALNTLQDYIADYPLEKALITYDKNVLIQDLTNYYQLDEETINTLDDAYELINKLD